MSPFLGKGRKTLWNTWGRFLEVTETFIRFSCVSKPSEYNIKIMVKFVVFMYDASCPNTRINDCKRYFFCKLNRTIDQCPPTQDAIEQHIFRSMLQGYIWSKGTQMKEQYIGVTDWGWDLDLLGDVNPPCIILPKVSKAYKELKTCNCKNLCSRDMCTCKNYAIPCSELCRCDGVCDN